MKTLYFDTETTSLSPGQICQLAYIIDDGASAAGKNFFFSVDTMNPYAQRVHGFTVSALDELSGNRTFPFHCAEISGDFRNADLIVAHNIEFDLRFLRKELERCGKALKVRSSFCSMKNFTPIVGIRGSGKKLKNPTLDELVRFVGLDKSRISRSGMNIYETKSVTSHDARYDSTAVYLCFKTALEQRLISL